jgi:uncharacterized protein YggT (Ycf19 family)
MILLLLRVVVGIAWLVVLTRAVASWIDPRMEKPVSRLAYRFTEPALAPLRRWLPRTGALDLPLTGLLLVLSLLLWRLAP